MKAFPVVVGILKYLSGAMLFCSLVAGCGPLDATKVAGCYVRDISGMNEIVLLSTNGTFRQEIMFTNDQKWSASGKWIVINRVIQLDNFYETFDIENQSIEIPPKYGHAFDFYCKHEELIRDAQPPWVRTNLTVF